MLDDLETFIDVELIESSSQTNQVDSDYKTIKQFKINSEELYDEFASIEEHQSASVKYD